MVYLGEFLINECEGSSEVKEEYSEFAKKIFGQFILTGTDGAEKRFKFLPNERSADRKLADLRDRIYDSVERYIIGFKLSAAEELVDEMRRNKKLV